MSSAAENRSASPISEPRTRRGGARLPVSPAVLDWAIERSGKDRAALYQRFTRLPAWECGEAAPTLRQLEDFAKATYVPVGYFFLNEPPVEELPIPDLRTIDDRNVIKPSANMLDTIYICQRRQDWYREYALGIGEGPLPFIGSANINSPVVETALKMRRDLNFNTGKWRNNPSWEASLRAFITQAEDAGIMVMVNGVVGNNTRRKLEPREFRGFALCDEFAPLVFINNADAKAAQMFTLAHELAHLWHGQSALSDVSPRPASSRHIERWCNSVAAELLLPLEELEQVLPPGNPLDAVQNIRRHFKVSPPVVLRRLYDAGRLSDEEFEQAYEQEQQRWKSQQGSGGNFYPTLMTRVGHRFAQAVTRNAIDGETLYRDACGLLGIRKMATFNELRERLGY